MTSLAALRAANRARQLEWKGGELLSMPFRALELGGEAGEALNVAKKIERERLGIPGSRATLVDLGDELADVIICADLVALGEGIDLGEALARKFNATSETMGLATRLEHPGPTNIGHLTVTMESPPFQEMFAQLRASAFLAGFEAANAGPGVGGVVSAYASHLQGVVCGEPDDNDDDLKAMLALPLPGDDEAAA